MAAKTKLAQKRLTLLQPAEAGTSQKRVHLSLKDKDTRIETDPN